MMSRDVRLSRLPVGSSASSRCGLFDSARAIATRCCSPPDSSRGRCCWRPPRPIGFEQRGGGRHRARRAARRRTSSPARRSPRAVIVETRLND